MSNMSAVRHGTSDHNVTETALDAAKCKLSAVTQRYFDDDLLHHFVPKPTRRIPLIHRGYYLRHTAISQCVDLFLAAHGREAVDVPPRVQIVSLGAGFDSLAFRLLQRTHRNVAFVEVDCDAIVREKRAVLTRDAATFAALFTASGRTVSDTLDAAASGALHVEVDALASSYTLLACDLGDVARLEALLFDAATGLDRSLPTLVLAECVVSYLEPTKGTALLRSLASWFVDATAVLYDPLGLTDPFGALLQRYFAVKGCELRALEAFQTARQHFGRFLLAGDSDSAATGWRHCRILDMNAIYAGCTDAREKERLSCLEVFDEYADWLLANAHYAIFLATTSRESPSTRVHWTRTFCAGPDVTPCMEATAVSLRAPSMPQVTDETRVVIRTFERSDLAAVQQLFESTHLEYAAASKAVKKFVAARLQTGDMRDVYASFMAPRRGTGASCFWVAELDGRVVGCIGLKPVDDATPTTGGSRRAIAAELCRLSVATSVRRRGVASALVRVLETFARARGYERVRLETIGAMTTAQQLYGALAYSEVARESFATFSLVRFEKALS